MFVSMSMSPMVYSTQEVFAYNDVQYLTDPTSRSNSFQKRLLATQHAFAIFAHAIER